MDELYTTILESCNWEEEVFVQGYGLLMGAIMAAKTPLSASALQSLHHSSLTLPVRTILRPLGSLLTGLRDETETQPIRILHLSLRDFLTARAATSPMCAGFYIAEKHHSERLALICLTILKEHVLPNMPGTGYLKSEFEGIPQGDEGHMSEELWYACRFWIDHVVDVEVPVSGLVDAIHTFLSTKAVLWIELVASKGQFQKLVKVREWLQVRYRS